MMNLFKKCLPPVLLLMAVGCSDTIATPPREVDLPPEPTRTNIDPLQWQVPLSFGNVRAEAVTENGTVALAPDVVHVASSDGANEAGYVYHFSFWAKRGAGRQLVVWYQTVENGAYVYKPYVRFVTYANSLLQRPDGTPVAPGDSVMITMSMNGMDLAVDMQPSGLQFNENDPPVLQMWYTGTQGDLNGDGMVDATDAQLESSLLLWVQQDPTDPWMSLHTSQDLSQDWVASWLQHFSGYAVAW